MCSTGNLLSPIFSPSLLNCVGCVVTWVTWVGGLRGSIFYVGCVGYVGQDIFYVGHNFYVGCVGQIYFCVGLCVGHNFLRGSKKILIGFHDIGFQYISCSLNPNSGYVKSHPISCSFTFT